MKPLSVGNVVSAGLRIYRDHFKEYYRIAFGAALWSFIPIYGWAKFMAHMGLISRLAFGEVVNKPETVKAAQKHTNPKLWKFLGTGILVILIFAGFYILWAIGVAILAMLAAFISSLIPGFVGTMVSLIVGITIVVSSLFLLIWLMSRYLIVEVPIAIEADHDASSTIKRSVDLSKGNMRHIYGIVMVAGLIRVPLWSVALILQGIPSYLSNLDIGILASFATLASLVVSAATSAFITPVWQSIKAVIYYNLLVRREGYGLELDV